MFVFYRIISKRGKKEKRRKGKGEGGKGQRKKEKGKGRKGGHVGAGPRACPIRLN